VFALGGSGAARVHEHFNLFFFIRVRITCRYIRRARYCKPSFLTKRYRRPEMFTLNWNLMHNAFDPFAFGFYGGVGNFTSRGKHARRVCVFLLYLVVRRRGPCIITLDVLPQFIYSFFLFRKHSRFLIFFLLLAKKRDNHALVLRTRHSCNIFRYLSIASLSDGISAE